MINETITKGELKRAVINTAMTQQHIGHFHYIEHVSLSILKGDGFDFV